MSAGLKAGRVGGVGLFFGISPAKPGALARDDAMARAQRFLASIVCRATEKNNVSGG
jgi:hypothetical protein